ncbi:Cx9C motif-containing protein 4, mitochondrial [Corynascus novoguineensis]|uniref:Cx9C motif-containing protein 4, mitochondrial n=1 Tax=Corynascus novoguineensis TaxID=1126955 RepID=A0AAN7HI41_9PEZI|nr:Cx9C motif-containing protein 4, mitochondrial [Corynascus novoguineensis]
MHFFQGLEQDLQSNPPCHPRAVPYSVTQDCLTRNGYNEAKCTKLVDALYECCQAFYERNGDNAVTASCPKPNLLRLKMEQRRKGIQ